MLHLLHWGNAFLFGGFSVFSRALCLALAAAALAPASGRAQVYLIDTLKSPHPETDSNFGASVGEGSIAITVGQPDASYSGMPSVGAAYLYDFAHWPLELRPLVPVPNARFGAAIRGELLIGAPGGTAVAGDPSPRGVVESWMYVPGGSWARNGILTPPDNALGGGFGTSISNSMAFYTVIGYPGYLDGAREAGAAMLFEQTSADTWAYQGSYISAHDGTGFGQNVVLAGGSRVLVGEPGFYDGNGASGVVSYFGDGLPLGTLMAGDGEAQGFGGSAMWENWALLIGVPYPHDAQDQPLPGRVYVFSWSFDTLEYTLTQTFSAPDGFPGDGFGTSIDLFGFTFAIGAPGMAVGDVPNAGAVWLFDNIGFDYTPRERKVSPRPAADGHFGAALTWRSGRLAIGAPGEPDGDIPRAGSVYVFATDPDVIFQSFFDIGF